MGNVDQFFCEMCRDFSDVKHTIIPITETIKNVTFTYDKKVAKCVGCDSEIFIPEIHDENLKARLEAYQTSSGLVGKEDIQTILDKYDIGKRPLSLLLGWGELTVTRYLNNSTPSREYSDILKELKDNPFYYSSRLEDAYRDKVITESAYKKSSKALEKLFAEDKLSIVAQYIIAEENAEVTPLALQKLLYYVAGFYLAFYSDALFNQQPEAWIHGPVYQKEYHKFKKYGYGIIDSTIDTSSLLNKKEKELIDGVVDAFAIYGGKPLEYMTHIEDPWLKTRGDLPEYENCDRIISRKLMEDYFKKVIAMFSIERPEEIKHYAKKQFELVTNQ